MCRADEREMLLLQHQATPKDPDALEALALAVEAKAACDVGLIFHAPRLEQDDGNV